MNDSFAVGEVAIYWRPESKHHGSEVTIARGLHSATVVDHTSGRTYPADVYTVTAPWLGPPTLIGPWCAQPHELRKIRRNGRDDLTVTSWDQCIWWPEALVRELPPVKT